MTFTKSIFYCALVFLTVSCATTNTSIYSTNNSKIICTPLNPDLGNIAILPETAWRDDQKEPEKRDVMFLNELDNAFKSIPCGSLSIDNGIRNISDWSSMSEREMRIKFSDENISTLIIIRIEELTPRLEVTFSIPFLWSGKSEADFRVKVISVKSGKILNDMRVKRVTGGPFNIRPAEWSKTELYEALRSII